jgi:hypothetical protein
MARRAVQKQEPTPEELEQISALQQKFVELLLTGRNISDAALEAGISRRMATYWMQPGHFCRFAYEHERVKLHDAFMARIVKLHDMTLKALEDALSEGAPPQLRYATARYLFGLHLAQYASAAPLKRAEELSDDIIDEAKTRGLLRYNDHTYLQTLEDDFPS